MPRARSKDSAGLPSRWKLKHGAYYYRVPAGHESAWGGKKWFRLGDTLPAAYGAWAERLKDQPKIKTIGALLDRYALEVVPTKAPKTQSNNLAAVPLLRAAFGGMVLAEFRPVHVYQYAERRNKTSRTMARREIAVLSHAFTKAVEWGLIERHPFIKQVRLKGGKSRTRYIEDWEFEEALALPSRHKKGSVLAIQAAMRIVMLTGMPRGDFLRLNPGRDFRDEGIYVQRHKTAGTTGVKRIYAWTDELRAAVELAKEARPVDIGPFLFCTRQGEGYFDEATGEASGWDSMWQRFMARLLLKTKITERFTEHDVRAKCASDATSIEHAQQLLQHIDKRITQRVYRRRPEVVQPLR